MISVNQNAINVKHPSQNAKSVNLATFYLMGIVTYAILYAKLALQILTLVAAATMAFSLKMENA